MIVRLIIHTTGNICLVCIQPALHLRLHEVVGDGLGVAHIGLAVLGEARRLVTSNTYAGCQ